MTGPEHYAGAERLLTIFDFEGYRRVGGQARCRRTGHAVLNGRLLTSRRREIDCPVQYRQGSRDPSLRGASARPRAASHGGGYCRRSAAVVTSWVPRAACGVW